MNVATLHTGSGPVIESARSTSVSGRAVPLARPPVTKTARTCGVLFAQVMMMASCSSESCMGDHSTLGELTSYWFISWRAGSFEPSKCSPDHHRTHRRTGCSRSGGETFVKIGRHSCAMGCPLARWHSDDLTLTPRGGVAHFRNYRIRTRWVGFALADALPNPSGGRPGSASGGNRGAS
jgi:hypothetical protein